MERRLRQRLAVIACFACVWIPCGRCSRAVQWNRNDSVVQSWQRHLVPLRTASVQMKFSRRLCSASFFEAWQVFSYIVVGRANGGVSMSNGIMRHSVAILARTA